MKLWYRIGPPFGEKFEVPIRLTTEGRLTCTLPAKISALFTAHGINLLPNRAGNPGFFSEESVKALNKEIGAVIEELCSEKEVSREKVIRYAIETACSYVIGDDGTYYPNGYYIDNTPLSVKDDAYRTKDGTNIRHSSNVGPYGIQIFVRPLEKVTFRYEATGVERVEYNPLGKHTFSPDPNDPIQWLCDLVAISSQRDHFHTSSLPTEELPYTEELAYFFINLLKGFFALNEKIKPFLNPEGIKHLAAQGTKLLGGGS